MIDGRMAGSSDKPFLVWNDAELQRCWSEDSPAYYLWNLRQSRKPIDEGNAVICRALGCWYQAMQHTKATEEDAALHDIKERLSPAHIQLLLTVHPDTLRRSISASPATKHAAQTPEHQAQPKTAKAAAPAQAAADAATVTNGVMMVEEFHTSGVEILIRRFKIAEQKAMAAKITTDTTDSAAKHAEWVTSVKSCQLAAAFRDKLDNFETLSPAECVYFDLLLANPP